MSTKQTTARRTRPKPAKEITVVVEAIAPEVEAELADRLARFLLVLTSPEEDKPPHTPG